MTGDHLEQAQEFLREAVYRSRAVQAAGVGLAGGQLDRPASPANCGLGEKAAVELELSPRGEELFHELWPEPPDDARRERIRTTMRAWVELQDALDRKRNHFLRDFRQTHGFDRRAYGPEESEAFEQGLERINREVDERLRLAARGLLGADGTR